ncbi:CHRD domain-containing protein [Hymenobacter sp. IS2118]|uniref:CHRD domain-containing protein n=1 Tax=Hymenobacter sp. IS2118 TaxID=1505605 RepID=UPI000552BE45|nr:CHRD domain-containing protein [Hymenobacter sp. IS2118]
MLRTILRLCSAAALLATPLLASADHLRPHLLLTARLSGAQEVPAVTTDGQGVAGFTLNATRDTLFVQAAASGLSGPITDAHVHEGAAGVAGPVRTSLRFMLRGNRLSGYLTGADIAPDRIAKYLRGLYYLNIHTAANPGGEIRGQILLETDAAFVANLTGGQQNPAVTTPATGLGIFSLSQSQDKLKFQVVFDNLSSALTVTHLHTGAIGTNGGVVVDLLPFRSGNVIEGEIVPTAAVVTSLTQGLIYINVHTATNGGGEIRGQLLNDSNSLALDARLDGAQMVPASASAAKGVATGRLVGTLDTVYMRVAYTGLSGPPVAINIHSALAGQANTVANLLATVPVVSGAAGNTTGNVVFFRIAAPVLTPAIVDLLLNTGLNVVITTAANPAGEIRGQVLRLAREGYTFSLNGAQERPNPVVSSGYGVGTVSIDRDQTNAHFMSVWGALSGPATMGHFHTGLATQSGGVVFNLTPFFDNATAPTALYGYWKNDNAAPFTARRSLQFRRDSVYLNIHTAANPSGEIRGQVFRGARNLQTILSTQPVTLVAGSFGVVPNPFAAALTLAFEARVAGTGLLRFTDVLGRPVATQTVVVRPGANSLPLALPNAAPGIYLLTLEVGSTRLVTRVAKE